MAWRMQKGFLAAAAAASFGALAGAGAAAYLILTPPAPITARVDPVWIEVKWPFPIDQWGTGKAFRCKASDCGTEVDIYLRAKIGFCNCATGVADDQELERVADFDLFGGRGTPLAPGHPIVVRWMNGRSRSYSFPGSPADGKSVLTIAFNERCDVIVATMVVGHNRAAGLESAALEFLTGDTVMRWAETTLGL
jgi:hypothetical protein